MQRHDEGGACGPTQMQRHEEGGGRSLRASDEEGGAGGRRSLRAGGRGRARDAEGAEESRSRRGRRTRGGVAAAASSRCARSPFFSRSLSPQMAKRAVDFSTWPSISRPSIDFPPASSVSFPLRSISRVRSSMAAATS